LTSLGSKILKGAIWTVTLRLFIKSLGLINTTILARILVPEDFGLLALVMSAYAFIQIIRAFGLDTVLIQNQNATDEMYNTAWTIQVLFGIISFAILFFISPFFAESYGDQRIEAISRFASVMFLFNGFTNIGIVNFRKNFDFHLEFQFQSSVKIISVIFTILLAFLLRNYWALVYGMLFSSILEVIFSFLFSNYRPKFDVSKVKEIFSFSSWLMLNNFLFFLNTRTKELITGKYAGIKSTGMLSLVNEFATLGLSEIVAPINRAAFPGYTKASNQISVLKSLYTKVMQGIAIIGIPSSIGISLVAPIFVPVVLGNNWIGAISVMQLLGFAHAITSINTNADYIFLALGNPKLTTIISSVKAIVVLFLLYILINKNGLIGAGQALLISAIIMFPVYFLFLSRYIKISLKDYLSPIIRPAICSIIMYEVSRYILFNPSTLAYTIKSASFFDLIAAILIGFLIYITSTILLWILVGRPKGIESFILEKIRAKIS